MFWHCSLSENGRFIPSFCPMDHWYPIFKRTQVKKMGTEAVRPLYHVF